MKRISLLVAVVFLCCAGTAHAGATARVLSVIPGVSFNSGGTRLPLAVKMDVPVSAMLESDATGKAQIILPDDSIVSIAPGTKLRLAEYVDAARKESIRLELLSGTARIVTGETNRRNPEAFTVMTPHASVGVRGTLVTIHAGSDATSVYLTETSGKGVSVRNHRTGQVLELRSPGALVNVSPAAMEERRAQQAEAASFNAALRGKSLAAAPAAPAPAAGELQKAQAASAAPAGSLPRAGLADPVQVAAVTTPERLTGAALAAAAAPAATLAASAVPAAESPAVPAVPLAPEVPAITPDPILPEQPVERYEITDFAEFANARYHGPGKFDFYIDKKFVATEGMTVDFTFPNKELSFDGSTHDIKLLTMNIPVYSSESQGFGVNGSFPRDMKLSLDGTFTIKGTAHDGTYVIDLAGAFVSRDVAKISKIEAEVLFPLFWSEGKELQTTVLKQPMEVTRY